MVVESPALEIFAYLDMELQKEQREAERERERFWIQYLSQLFSHPPDGKEHPERRAARQQFVEAIKPKDKKKIYEWNIPPEVLKNAERLKLEGPEKGG